MIPIGKCDVYHGLRLRTVLRNGEINFTSIHSSLLVGYGIHTSSSKLLRERIIENKLRKKPNAPLFMTISTFHPESNNLITPSGE